MTNQKKVYVGGHELRGFNLVVEPFYNMIRSFSGGDDWSVGKEARGYVSTISFLFLLQLLAPLRLPLIGSFYSSE